MHLVGKYAWLLFVIIPLLLLVIGLSGPQGPVGPGTPIAAFGVAHPSEIDLELRFRGNRCAGHGGLQPRYHPLQLPERSPLGLGYAVGLASLLLASLGCV